MSHDTVSFSEANTLSACEMKWHYRYVLDRDEGTKGKALSIGSLYHAGADAITRTRFVSRAHGYDVVTALAEEEGIDPQGEAVETVLWLLDRYFVVYGDEPYGEYVGEERCELDLSVLPGNVSDPARDVTLVGIIDGLKTDEDGHVWLVERKTSGRPTDAMALAEISPQVTLYDVLAREVLGIEPYGIIVEVANTYRWKKEREPGESFSRRYFDRTEEQRALALDWIYTILDRRYALITGAERPIRNVGRDCLYCPFRMECLEGMAFVPNLVEDPEEQV
jgi:hypothetical protein